MLITMINSEAAFLNFISIWDKEKISWSLVYFPFAENMSDDAIRTMVTEQSIDKVHSFFQPYDGQIFFFRDGDMIIAYPPQEKLDSKRILSFVEEDFCPSHKIVSFFYNFQEDMDTLKKINDRKTLQARLDKFSGYCIVEEEHLLAWQEKQRKNLKLVDAS